MSETARELTPPPAMGEGTPASDPDDDEAAHEGETPPEGDDEATGDNGDAVGDTAPDEADARVLAPLVDMEKALKALDREQTRHAKRVEEIMGADFAAYAACVLCDTLGFTDPSVRVIEAYRFDPSAGQPILVTTGERPEELYEVNPDTTECATCKGYGLVRTGSKNPAAAVGPCPRCAGQGWIIPTNVTAMPAAPAPVAQPSEVDALRAKGYTVIEPYQAPATQV